MRELYKKNIWKDERRVTKKSRLKSWFCYNNLVKKPILEITLNLLNSIKSELMSKQYVFARIAMLCKDNAFS